MKYVFGALRVLCLMFSLGFMAFAAVGAAQERVKRDALPTRIGEPVVETSFLEDVQLYATNMWLDFYIAYLPGMVPAPVVYDRQDPTSLDALKTRTRSLPHTYAADGTVDVPQY